MPSSTKAAALACSIVAASTAAGSAMAQSLPYRTIEAPKTWRVDLGGGLVHGFSAAGSSSEDVNFTAWGSASYKDVVYANGLDGLGWNILNADGLRAGVQLRPRFSAGEIEGSDLDRPDLGADASIYAYKRLPGNVVVGGRVSHDATGDEAGTEVFASAGHQRVTPIGLLSSTAYVRGADTDRVQAYYGVSPAEAPGSGFSAFEPEGGVTGAGAALLLAVPVGRRFGVGSFINYEQRLGDIKDSPLVEKDHVWRAGLIGVVRFSSAR